METTNQQTPSKFIRLTAWLPLLWLSLAFLAGILVAKQIRLSRSFWLGLAHSVLPPQIHLSRNLWLVLAGIVLLSALLLRILSSRAGTGTTTSRLNFKPFKLPPSTLFLASLALTVFFLGAARYHFTLPYVDVHYIAWYNDREYEVLVTGTLTDPPDERDTYTNLRVNVTGIDTGDETLPRAPSPVLEPGLPRGNRDHPVPCWNRDYHASSRSDPRPPPARRRLALR